MTDDTNERQLQAGEYVLGTLAGGERRAFEDSLAADPALRAEVAAWETRLAGLGDAIVPVQPPARVWRRIEDAIEPRGAGEADGPATWWRSLWVWRSLTAITLLTLLAVTLPPLWQTPSAPLPVYAMVLRDAATQPQWLLVCDWRTRELTVTRVAAAAPAAGRVPELWLIPSGDAPPRSLGVLDYDRRVGALPAGASWRTTKAFAVSLEPAGGSPSGQPSGPVLYSVPVPT